MNSKLSKKEERLKEQFLEYAEVELSQDASSKVSYRELVIIAVKQDGYNLNFASKEIKDDKEVVIEALKQTGGAIMYASKQLRQDKNIVLIAVEKDGLALEDVPREFKNDIDIVTAAIKENCASFSYASASIRKNIEFIKLALISSSKYPVSHGDGNYNNIIGGGCGYKFTIYTDYYNTLQYIPDKLKKNRDLVKFAVQQNGYNLMSALEEFRDDLEIVLLAVSNNGLALQLVSDRLRNDRNVVITALEKDGDALQFASKKLQNDKEVVITAIKNYDKSLQYASDRLLKNKQFLLQVVTSDNYKCISQARQEDKELQFAKGKSFGHRITIRSINTFNVTFHYN